MYYRGIRRIRNVLIISYDKDSSMTLTQRKAGWDDCINFIVTYVTSFQTELVPLPLA